MIPTFGKNHPQAVGADSIATFGVRSIGERRSGVGLASTGLLTDRLWQVKKSSLPEETLLAPEFLRSEEHDGCNQQKVRTNVRQRTRNLELFFRVSKCSADVLMRDVHRPPWSRL